MSEASTKNAGGVTDDTLSRAVVDHVPVAIVVTSLDGFIVFINRAAEDLFGYPLEDVTGQGLAFLLPPSPERRVDPVKWLARWAAEPQPGPTRWLDFMARRRTGEEMPVEVRVAQGAVGETPRYFLTVRDNTALRQEQAASRQSSLRAARILLVAEDAIVTCDSDQRITFFNLKAEEMFGYGAEEVMGLPLTTLLPEGAREDHPDHVAAFGAGPSPSRMMSERREVRGLRRDGEEFPIEATITKVAVDGVLTYTAHVRDITARKKAQLALAESERRFRAMFDHAFDAIALLDPLGIVLEINRAARALTQGSESLTGRPLWDLPWLHGAQGERGESARDRLKEAIAVAASGVATRYTAQLGDADAARKIDLTLTPISDRSGKVVYILPEGRDVTGHSF